VSGDDNPFSCFFLSYSYWLLGPESPLTWTRSQWLRAYPVSDNVSIASYLHPDYVHPPNVTDRGRAHSDETSPKTVTFDDSRYSHEQTTPTTETHAKTETYAKILTPTDSPAMVEESSEAAEPTAMESPSRPLPSPPHTLRSDNAGTIYSQLDFRSTNSSSSSSRRDDKQDNGEHGNCMLHCVSVDLHVAVYGKL